MQKTQLAPVAHAGFPVRSLTRKLKGEGGEWITAYRVEQKKRFTTTLSHTRPDGSLSRLIHPPTNTREVSGSLSSRGHVLNKEFLLHRCYVSKPSDLSVVSIRGSNLERCVPEELAEFQNVIHVDAADNKLALESFSHFPCLEGLELPLNGVVDAQLSPGDFPHLTNLDLSYNTLSGLIVIDLGLLPALRELHLTGNNLVALPVEMTRPYSHSDNGYSIRFPALEKLWLDDNKLSDQSSFATLAGLRKLKYLNLDNNEFYSIPQLKLLGSSQMKQPQPVYTPPETPPPETQQDSYVTPTISTSNQRMTMDANNDNTNQEISPGDLDEGTDKDKPSTDSSIDTVTGEQKLQPEQLILTDGQRTEDLKSSEIVIATNSQNLQNDTHSPIPIIDELTQQSKQEFSSSKDDSLLQTNDAVLNNTPQDVGPHHHLTLNQVSPGREHSQPDAMSVAPFPELDTLSLVNNLILSAEGVLACESWPMFKKLLIYDNPFTAAHKGLHPLLQGRLVNQCGIKVVRKKPSSTHKHHIGSKAMEFKKVSSLPPPPIPRCPLPAIEPPPLDLKAIGYTPSVSQTHSSIRSYSPESSNSLGSLLDSEESEQQGVFMTQVVGEEPDSSSSRPNEGLAAPTNSVKDDFEARRREVKEKYKDVPDRYKGYEILLDVYDDPHTKIPSDINGCVRALSYALKHPRTLNSKPPAPSSLSSSSTVSQLTGNYLKKKTLPLEPLPQSKTHGKVREIRGVLEDIRSQATTIETNLSVALKPSPKKRSISQLQRESKKLLAELQTCYDRVRASSLRTTVTVDQEERGQGQKLGTPRRVQFSRDVQTLTTSSPRNTARTSSRSRDSTV